MRITKVYTRTGDSGKTALVGGNRVQKNHDRINAYGTVDELNAILGIIVAHTRQSNQPEVFEPIEAPLLRIQNHLFNVGADLATLPEHRWAGMIRVGTQDVGWLEGEIDRLNEGLEPLKEFILPGGGIISTFCHQARTVCRRAERESMFLLDLDLEAEDLGVLTYLNRLSDYLFVLGRWVAKTSNETETFWKRNA